MYRIENFRDAEEIILMSIEKNKESQRLAEEENTKWFLVGGLKQTKGEFEYRFDLPNKLTMYSFDLNIRRKLTTMELEIALTTIWEDEIEEY